MERKAYSELLDWKSKGNRTPLIVLGCRQVGKTFLAKKLGESEYEKYVYLNFAENDNDRMLFEGNLDAKSIIDRIVLSKNVGMIPGKTLLILDEIQECDNAYYSLKPLSADGRFDVLAPGSFLGVVLESKRKTDEHRVSPMGYCRTVMMHPMDFEEFCWAMGINKDLLSTVSECIRTHSEVDTYYNKILNDLFRRYLVVGGMPAAVKAYSETNDYSEVMKVLDDIVTILRLDAGKYSNNADMMRIHSCLMSIPSQLANNRKSFQYYDIEKIKGSGKRLYGTSISWLENAGIALKCRNLLSVDPPLENNIEEDTYKLFLCDTGLLMSLSRYQDVHEIVMGDPYVNNGSLMENAVANALYRKGYPLYYYAKKNSTLEIDFVIKHAGSVCMIEVKSGRNKRSKSLNTMLAEKNRNRSGIKVCEDNITMDVNGALHMPLYGPCLMEGPSIPDFPPVDVEAVNKSFTDTDGNS